MAKCDFNIAVTDPIEVLIERAKKGIEKKGGSLNGDTTQGNYEIPTQLGKITGDYSVIESDINFIIKSKPVLVSCKKIEDELRKYLNSTDLTDPDVIA